MGSSFFAEKFSKTKKMCYNRNIFLGTEDKVMEKSKVYFTDFRTRLGEGLPSKLKRLMKAGSVLFADDVLLYGWVSGAEPTPPKRRSIVDKIRGI